MGGRGDVILYNVEYSVLCRLQAILTLVDYGLVEKILVEGHVLFYKIPESAPSSPHQKGLLSIFY